MDDLLSPIKSCPLFSGVSDAELQSMMHCLQGRQRKYDKGALLLHPGDATREIGLLLQGQVQILQEDFWGNSNLLSMLQSSDIFGESFACTPGSVLTVSVQAAEPCIVLFLDVRRILNTCASACPFHAQLIRNLLSILAEKNLHLNAKLSFISQRTTRQKLLTYLSAESVRQGSASFTIPFLRQQLADYLSVDRSAMTTELSRMRQDGMLTFQGRQFVLLQKA